MNHKLHTLYVFESLFNLIDNLEKIDNNLVKIYEQGNQERITVKKGEELNNEKTHAYTSQRQCIQYWTFSI